MTLFPYQEEAVEKILKEKNFLLYDDCGLGKTRVCIEVVNRTPTIKRVAVILPAYLKLNWKDEVAKWGNGGAEYSFFSYNYFTREERADGIKKGEFDIAIVDESQRIKSWETKWTRNICRKVLPKIPRKIFCSGTPLVKHAGDLHPTLASVQPGRWGTYGEFCERCCQKIDDPWSVRGYKWGNVTPAAAANLKKILSPIMLRRFKKDVLKDLPEKVRIEIRLEVNLPETRINIGDLENEAVIVDDNFTKERVEVGLAKVPHIMQWIDDLDPATSFVVFTWHREVAFLLGERIGDLGRSTSVIVGGTSPIDRHRIVNEFQNGEISCLIGTIGAMGTGVNLTAASVCLFAEMSVRFDDMVQAEDRLLRIGQKNTVHSYKFIAVGTVDEKIRELYRHKQRIADKTVEQKV